MSRNASTYRFAASPVVLADTGKVREMERQLSAFTFRGVPIGAILAGVLHDEVWGGKGDWGVCDRLKNRLRFHYHLVCPFRCEKEPRPDLSFFKSRILLTCSGTSRRLIDLVVPVAQHLGFERCVVLCPSSETAALLPEGICSLVLDRITGRCDHRAWHQEFMSLWIKLRPALKRMMLELNLPRGVYDRIAAAVVIGTQRITRSESILRRSGVAAVLSDHDRSYLWAPLVLSARVLGLPTFTLMHGTFGAQCAGYYPLLADKIFCWGSLQREMLISAGAEADRMIVAGCPRLTRELALSSKEAKAKSGLDPEKLMVMLATAPYRLDLRHQLVEVFCLAVQRVKMCTAVVRLHSSEKLEHYAEIALRFPAVRFMLNDESSVDDALAAADVVVVHSSGFGSDALVKGRLTVILDAIDLPLGHGQELIDYAGCLRATSSENLTEILSRLLRDEEERYRLRQSAEQYVQRFCAYFGEDSAHRIASRVLQAISTPAEREQTMG
jgi:hypothetical protein